jgi:hypothetical protein
MNSMRLFKCILLVLLFLSLSAVAAGGVVADKVLIEKKARRLTLFSKGQEINVYKVALGRNPEGAKEREGDNKTPEGTYVIDSRNTKSGYHLSLHISYPNKNDKRRAKELGVSPGGNIDSATCIWYATTTLVNPSKQDEPSVYKTPWPGEPSR